MRTLTVTLSPSLPTPATPVVAVLSADGVTASRHIEVPLALLPDTGEAEVVAVVPWSKLSWHALELPRGTLDKKMFQEGNSARLRTVLEGLLEDRVLDEPAQLHFALAPGARSGEPVWVAACDRAWLQAWLGTLEQAGRPAQRITPEVAPSVSPGAAVAPTLHFLGTAAQAQLMVSGAQGVCVLPYGAESLALFGATGSDGAPAQIWAEPAVAELAEQHFEGRVALQTAPQRYLASARSEWDLAQFDCAASRGARQRKRLSSGIATLMQAPHWRAARWALVALLAVNLMGIAGWNWKEQSALADKRAAIREVLTSTFPDVKVVVDAPLQMARAVSDLQRQTGTATGADLETMLLQFYSMAPAATAPAAIEFAAGELKIKGMDPTAKGTARITAKLAGMGYQARLEGDTLVMQQERRP